MSFDEAWVAVCDHDPIGHQLKTVIPDRWVRFYSLPEGKRYAESADEHETVRRRADALITHTCGQNTELMLVTAIGDWGTDVPELDEDARAVHADAERWRVVEQPDPDGSVWSQHLWASWQPYQSRSLDDLVDRTADERLVEVLLVAPQAKVILHPYDGGMDVFTASALERDALRATFVDWASPLASGL